MFEIELYDMSNVVILAQFSNAPLSISDILFFDKLMWTKYRFLKDSFSILVIWFSDTSMIYNIMHIVIVIIVIVSAHSDLKNNTLKQIKHLYIIYILQHSFDPKTFDSR